MPLTVICTVYATNCLIVSQTVLRSYLKRLLMIMDRRDVTKSRPPYFSTIRFSFKNKKRLKITNFPIFSNYTKKYKALYHFLKLIGCKCAGRDFFTVFFFRNCLHRYSTSTRVELPIILINLEPSNRRRIKVPSSF